MGSSRSTAGNRRAPPYGFVSPKKIRTSPHRPAMHLRTLFSLTNPNYKPQTRNHKPETRNQKPVDRLRLHLLLVFARSDPIDLFKGQDIVADAGIPDLVSYLADRLGVISDHLL